MSWKIGVLGFESRKGLGIFFFTTASRKAVGPTQPPIQWVPGALSLGIKRLGRETDHLPLSSAEIKDWVELYLYSPIRLHGVVLNLKSTGTILPSPLWCCGKIAAFRRTLLPPSSAARTSECWYLTATPHGVKTRKTSTWIFTDVKTSNGRTIW
jgi:hypothetical protein